MIIGDGMNIHNQSGIRVVIFIFLSFCASNQKYGTEIISSRTVLLLKHYTELNSFI